MKEKEFFCQKMSIKTNIFEDYVNFVDTATRENTSFKIVNGFCYIYFIFVSIFNLI